jgi:hypothetical protein
MPGCAQAAGPGRDFDDVARALLAHDGDGGTGQVDHTVEVRIDLRFEVVFRHLFEGRRIGKARLVDQNVKTAKGIDCDLDSSLRSGRIVHVKSGQRDLIVVRTPGGRQGDRFSSRWSQGGRRFQVPSPQWCGRGRSHFPLSTRSLSLQLLRQTRNDVHHSSLRVSTTAAQHPIYR